MPRLWAGRKVDALLSTMRANGESDELVKEVTYLAKRYGIVTPYTSYLMTTDIVNAAPSAPGQGLVNRLKNAQASDAKGDGAAVPLAKKMAEARRQLGGNGASEGLDKAAEEAYHQAGKQGSFLQKMHYIGNRTFYRSEGVWYDSAFDKKKYADLLNTVKVGSDEYVDLMTKHTPLMKYMALGDVVVKYKGKWYRFETKKAEK